MNQVDYLFILMNNFNEKKNRLGEHGIVIFLDSAYRKLLRFGVFSDKKFHDK